MSDAVDRFHRFRQMVGKEVFSEPDSVLHRTLIEKIIPLIHAQPDGPRPGDAVLDIGCGPGLVLDELVKVGLNPSDLTGVTLGETDLQRTRDKGYTCHPYDMSFTLFPDEHFDYAIVRHALEHSPWPYLTLLEFNRIMKFGGRIYVEMPAPGGDRKLEDLPNHYSIMDGRMWGSLFYRAGFDFRRGTYPVKIEVEGKSLAEPYDWYILTRLLDRRDLAPADDAFMMTLAQRLRDARKLLS